MRSPEPSAAAILQELERVLASPGFVRNERLGKLLRFLVEQHLRGTAGQLKETSIGIEFFERKDYDPKGDSLVRTEAARLRSRLSEYYAEAGSRDAVVIELPKGGYAPVIRAGGDSGKLWRWRKAAIAAALIFAILVSSAVWLASRRGTPVNIAVLPLENLGHDPANDYFVDGLTAEIIRNLSAIDGLAVRSQTSSFAFRGKPQDVREAGKQLGADYIVEGSVLRAGQQLRIDAQFIRVRDDSPVWSGRFDRELTDIFAIQDEISRGIVNGLRLKLGRGRRRYETSSEAYDLYLQARALEQGLVMFGKPQSRIALYERVIAMDGSFAPAYAGLASVYAGQWSSFFPEDSIRQQVDAMHATASKALDLDPLLPEAHRALGFVHIAERDWAQAEKSFRRALELDPSSSETHSDFAAQFLMTTGRINEAVEQARAAVKVDPLSPPAHSALAFVLLSAERYSEAAGEAQKFPVGISRFQLPARALLGQGRIEEAIRLLEQETGNPNTGFLGYAYARAGRRAEAEKLAEAATRPNIQVLIYAGLGDKDRTFEALDRTAAVSVWRVGQYLTYPELSLLRGDPRLKTFRKKIGLPE